MQKWGVGTYELCGCKAFEFPAVSGGDVDSAESCFGGFRDCARVVTDMSADAFASWIWHLRRKIESCLPDGCEMTVVGTPSTSEIDEMVPFVVKI